MNGKGKGPLGGGGTSGRRSRKAQSANKERKNGQNWKRRKAMGKEEESLMPMGGVPEKQVWEERVPPLGGSPKKRRKF